LNPVEPEPPRPSPEPSQTLLNLTWLCTKASQTFTGTLLNLTWLCTKASQTFSGTFGTFSGTLYIHDDTYIYVHMYIDRYIYI